MSTLVVLAGTVDSDPEKRSTNTGKSVGSFRVDTGEGWFTVSAWEALADKMPPKGTPVVVTGKLRTRSYEDKDKRKVYVTEVNATTINVVGPKEEGEGDNSDLGF